MPDGPEEAFPRLKMTGVNGITGAIQLKTGWRLRDGLTRMRSIDDLGKFLVRIREKIPLTQIRNITDIAAAKQVDTAWNT